VGQPPAQKNCLNLSELELMSPRRLTDPRARG
jgi:hypothetical protein